MNAIENKIFRKPYIALMFGDSKLKYWSDEAKKELAKEIAEKMMSTNWSKYYKALKKKRTLGKPDYIGDGITYDTSLGVELVIDFRKGWEGLMYVDG